MTPQRPALPRRPARRAVGLMAPTRGLLLLLGACCTALAQAELDARAPLGVRLPPLLVGIAAVAAGAATPMLEPATPPSPAGAELPPVSPAVADSTQSALAGRPNGAARSGRTD